VQLAGQPAPLLDQRQLAAVLEQPGLVDGDGSVRGQQHHRRLVARGEGVGALLVGQVEGADDVAGRHDGHTQERAHAGMGRGPPAPEAGIPRDVVGAVGRGVGQHGVEDPVGAGERAQLGDQLVAHAHRDELGELVALGLGHADGGVTGPHQLAGADGQLVQHPVQ
jgi:hypothetical protein